LYLVQNGISMELLWNSHGTPIELLRIGWPPPDLLLARG
jgi:hypothetical protein